MKKCTAPSFLSVLLAFAACALCFSPCARAQLLEETRVGVKAGATYSRLQLQLENTDRQVGGVAGLMARFPLSEAFFLQPEVLYVQKGGTTQFSSSGEGGQLITVSQDFALDYLEVPLTLHLRLPIENLWPTLFAGPYGSVALREGYEVTPSVVHGEPLEEEGPDYEPLDYGFVLGASLDVPVGERVLVLDARYDFGFRDLDTSGTFGDVTDQVDLSARNDAFLFSIGLMF